jgi:hypothetical protein
LDDVADGLVGFVVCGFQFAVGTGVFVGLVVKESVCEGTAYVPFLRCYPGFRIPQPLEVTDNHGTMTFHDVATDLLRLTCKTKSGVIFQTFATVPGTVYNLSFEYGNNPDGSGATMNALVPRTLLNQTVSHNTSIVSNMNYQLFSQDFTADSAATTITFSAITNSGYGIVLDAVSATMIAATPVPLPTISAVVNAASFQNGPASPGEIVTIGGAFAGIWMLTLGCLATRTNRFLAGAVPGFPFERYLEDSR